MEVNEILKTHDQYKANAERWRLYDASYNGIEAYVERGYILRQPRESQDNYRARLAEAVGFGFSQAVIDLYSFFLNDKQASRVLGLLEDDPSWGQFMDDADMYGTDFHNFRVEAQRLAAIYGHVGIFVDKPAVSFQSRAQEVAAKVYPYVCIYTPLDIIDWSHEINDFGRPVLTYLKLKLSDSKYRIWTTDAWEEWEIKEGSAALAAKGGNTLGEIPFFWFFNVKDSQNPWIGISDLRNIARIDLSIVNDLSNGSEVVKYAAFPMMRKPAFIGSGKMPEDLVSASAVLEFDPDNPDSKPDWLLAPVREPIDALLRWIDTKISNIYRSAHLSGVNALGSGQNRSGVSLRWEFQMVASVLSKKAENMAEAERCLIYFWLRWQQQDEWYEGITITRPKNFAVDDLQDELRNILTAKTIVMSNRFNQLAQKKVVRLVLPEIPSEDVVLIDEEIDASKIVMDLDASLNTDIELPEADKAESESKPITKNESRNKEDGAEE